MLPFRQFATVTDAGGERLGIIRLSTWKAADPREMPGGVVWSWSGEAEIEAAPLLVDKSNVRRLYVVDTKAELYAGGGSGSGDDGPPPGRRLGVLAAVRHDFLPHVELRLQEVTGG